MGNQRQHPSGDCLLQLLGCKGLLPAFDCPGLAPFNDLMMSLHMSVQRMVQLILKSVREYLDEHRPNLLGTISHQLLPILLNQLSPTVQMICQIVHGLALRELLKKFTTTVVDQLPRAFELFIELPPHLETIAWSIA